MTNNILFEAYMHDLNIQNQAIITEDAVEKLKELVDKKFQAFKQCETTGDMIVNGETDLNQLSTTGKSAINNVTEEFSILKKPTDGLVNLGQEKVGPLFNKPVETANNGGDLKASTNEMLSQTKDIFGNGVQDTLKGSANIEESKFLKIKKQTKLLLQSRPIQRKLHQTQLKMEAGFKQMIMENIHMHKYDHIKKPIIIETSNSTITIKPANIKHNVIYEENFKTFKHKNIIMEAMSEDTKTLINALKNRSYTPEEFEQLKQTTGFKNLQSVTDNNGQLKISPKSINSLNLLGGSSKAKNLADTRNFLQQHTNLSTNTSIASNNDNNISISNNTPTDNNTITTTDKTNTVGGTTSNIADTAAKPLSRWQRAKAAGKADLQEKGNKAKEWLKNIFRPFFNLIIYIISLLVRLIVAILVGLIKIIEKLLSRLPGIGKFLAELNISEQLKSWGENFKSIKFQLTEKDILSKIRRTFTINCKSITMGCNCCNGWYCNLSYNIICLIILIKKFKRTSKFEVLFLILKNFY